MKGRKAMLPPERRDEFIKLWMTETNAAMAERFGIPPLKIAHVSRTVRNWQRSQGMQPLPDKPRELQLPRKANRSEVADEVLIELKGLGLSNAEIALEIGYSRQFVVKRVRKIRDRLGEDSVAKPDRHKLALITLIDSADHNPLYEVVPWHCRITGRDQRAGIAL